MNRPIAYCLPAVLLILVPAVAFGKPAERYQRIYERVDSQNAGPYEGGVAGRNIVDDGVATKSGSREATVADLRDGIEVMLRMLNPVEVSLAPVPGATVAAAPAAPAYTGTGTYAIPESIVACESGGDYSASNPSGAYGAYQIMPGTAASYGCDLSTPAGQDACAAEIYAAEGSAPWACG